MEKKSNAVVCSPSDFCLSGVLIGRQKDDITYTSKKTGQSVTAQRDVLILQTSFGIAICRSFASDPKAAEVAASLVVGENITLPLTGFQIEQGVKCFNVRLV